MSELTDKIAQVDGDELQALLSAIRDRYAELFPNWEVNVISLEKNKDRNQQIDRMINMLQGMKEA